MMKLMTVLMSILFLGIVCLWPMGCSDDEPREKTILEKLNSDNLAEQQQGLDEANEKYGGGQ